MTAPHTNAVCFILKMTMNKVAIGDDQLDTVSGGTILPYKVEAGDTLESIAAKYHVTVNQIKQWNNIQGDSLMAGQPLKLKF